jgi:hypothetical protein
LLLLLLLLFWRSVLRLALHAALKMFALLALGRLPLGSVPHL